MAPFIKRDIHEISSKDPIAAKSLRSSFWDGVFASGMNGFTLDYFTPFLLVLGGSARLVGFLNSFFNLAGSLAQLKSADLAARLGSRKKVFVFFVFLQAFMLLPMIVLALSGLRAPFLFIGTVVLFVACGSIATPSWSSLMSDLVLTGKRGAYFGWRNKVIGLVAVAASFCAGFILQGTRGSAVAYGFAALFSLAFLFRLLSGCFLARMHEPFLAHKKEDQFTLLMFWGRLKESNFAKFVLFVAVMNFSVNLASPFFAVLMLRDLKFSYALYAVLTATATLTVCLMMGRWGRQADQVGNLKVIKVTSLLIGLVPLLWIINRHPAFLFLAQVFSGFAWAGFNLCTSNFILDAVTPEKRTRCIAYFNVFNGLALCLGSFLGGLFLRYLPSFSGYNILSLFLISSFLRIGVALLLPGMLREVRPVREVDGKALFMSVLGLKPAE
jgi:MFS family permease